MNYPNGIKKDNKNHQINYKNRGMQLEEELNLSNEYYREINKAFIYKKPTPIKIVKTSFPSRDKAVIKEAYFTIPSTTDYNGLYKGKYIDFEAKETKSHTSFTLSNIHEHQIKHLENIYKNDGVAFLIVRFTSLDETYLLMAKDLIDFIDNNKRKSIPIEYFKKRGYNLPNGYMPRVDYLKVIDNIIGGKDEEKK